MPDIHNYRSLYSLRGESLKYKARLPGLIAVVYEFRSLKKNRVKNKLSDM